MWTSLVVVVLAATWASWFGSTWLILVVDRALFSSRRTNAPALGRDVAAASIAGPLTLIVYFRRTLGPGGGSLAAGIGACAGVTGLTAAVYLFAAFCAIGVQALGALR